MAFVRTLGAHSVIDFKRQRFEEQVQDADAVIDLLQDGGKRRRLEAAAAALAAQYDWSVVGRQFEAVLRRAVEEPAAPRAELSIAGVNA